MRFHHLGLAVRDPRVATLQLRAMGYSTQRFCWDPLQGVDLMFMTAQGQPAIEVISARAGTPSPVDRILQATATAIYHHCLEVDSVRSVVQRWRHSQLSFDLVGSPTPAVLFEGRFVSFYRVRGVGIVEFLECGGRRPC